MEKKERGRGGRGWTVWAAFNNKRKEVEPKFYSVEEEDEATGGKKKEKQEKKKNKLAQKCQSIRAENIRKAMTTTFDNQDEFRLVLGINKYIENTIFAWDKGGNVGLG